MKKRKIGEHECKPIKTYKPTKKLISVLLVIALIICSIPLSALASDNTIITSADSISELSSNSETVGATMGVIDGSLSTYKHELHYCTYNSKTYIAFCVEAGETSPTGRKYDATEFKILYAENSSTYAEIAEGIYWGYVYQYGYGLPTTTAAEIAACCTQNYVWSMLGEATGSYAVDTWDSTYCSSSLYASWYSKMKSLKSDYEDNNVAFNNTTITATGTITTLTDDVLADYPEFSITIDGVIFSHEEDSTEMTIDVSKATSGEVTFNTLLYDIFKQVSGSAITFDQTVNNYLYFNFDSGDIQNLIVSNYIDPQYFTLTIETLGGFSFYKTDLDGTDVDDAVFYLYEYDADGNYDTSNYVTKATSKNGLVSFDNLTVGYYTVIEYSAPDGYTLHTASHGRIYVEAGTTSETNIKDLTIYDGELLCNFSIVKGNKYYYTSKDSDDTIAGVEFVITAAEDITNESGSYTYFEEGDVVGTITTDDDGVASTQDVTFYDSQGNEIIEYKTAYEKNGTEYATDKQGAYHGLPVGKYTVTEVDDTSDQYALYVSTDKVFTVKEGKLTTTNTSTQIRSLYILKKDKCLLERINNEKEKQKA